MTAGLPDRPLAGVISVCVSMFIIGFLDNYIRVIAGEASVWQFHLFRSLITVPAIVIAARLFGWRLRPRRWRPVILRSFFFATSMMLYFGAAGMIPVAQAGAGLFTSPIFVLLISSLFLGMRIGIWRIASVALGFGGMLVVVKPDPADFQVLSVIPVAAGLFYALNGIATRRWCQGESTLTLLVGLFTGMGIYGFFGVLAFTFLPVPPSLAETLPFFAQPWAPPSWVFLKWTGIQAFGSLFAVFLLTRGYQLAEVTLVAVFEFSFLVFAAFWTWVLWGEILDFASALGIAAIVVSGVIIVLRGR